MLKSDEQWRKELADFLKSRRQRLNPVTLDAEIISNGSTRRRTPGLRREEVASLAGVGLTWYTWLEQGRPIRFPAKSWKVWLKPCGWTLRKKSIFFCWRTANCP